MKIDEIIGYYEKLKKIYGDDFEIEIHERSDSSYFYFVLKKNTKYGELLFLVNHNHLYEPFSARISIEDSQKNIIKFLKGIK